MKIKNIINENKIIAIVRGVKNDALVPLVETLYTGGIRLVEITINQSGDPKTTADAIYTLCEKFDGRVEIGAGTVMNAAQTNLVIDAGAKYIISPNVSEEVIKRAKERGVISIPGAFTPTEAVTAYDYGADYVKVFPAGTIGASYIKAIAAPLSHIPFLAVGGIDHTNILDYLKSGACGVGIGGALTNPDTPPETLIKNIEVMTGKVEEFKKYA
jgi:2-keto-3-deoxy-6-phosphogluconate aldolase